MKKELQDTLKSQGWRLYILDGCPHCNTQLEDIPLFKNYITYSRGGYIIKNDKNSDNKNEPILNIDNKNEPILNIDKNSDNKNDEPILNIDKIYAFPLWYNVKTKKKIYGVQDIKSILEIYAAKKE
jgi:hypothetical protein